MELAERHVQGLVWRQREESERGPLSPSPAHNPCILSCPKMLWCSPHFAVLAAAQRYARACSARAEPRMMSFPGGSKGRSKAKKSYKIIAKADMRREDHQAKRLACTLSIVKHVRATKVLGL